MYDNEVSDEDDYPSNADVVTEFEQAMRGVRALIIPTICTGTETCEDPSHD